MIDQVLTWGVVPGADLLFESWEDEVIVYNCLSGETHQMDSFSFTVLEQVIKASSTEQQLFRDICKLYPLENHSEIQRLLIQTVKNFDQIGLIEPCY